MKKFIIQHRQYLPTCTVSYVYIDAGDQFCFALEDIGRGPGVKIPGETCIPEGVYRATGTESTRFKKRMIQLFNIDDRVEKDGVAFTGVRIHGGNTIEDTEGCPLYAYNYDDNETIWRKASDDLLDYIDHQERMGFEIYVIICS